MHLPQIAALQPVSEGTRPAAADPLATDAEGFQGVFAQAKSETNSVQHAAEIGQDTLAGATLDGTGHDATGTAPTETSGDGGQADQPAEGETGDDATSLFAVVPGEMAMIVPGKTVSTGPQAVQTEDGPQPAPEGAIRGSTKFPPDGGTPLRTGAPAGSETASNGAASPASGAVAPRPDHGPLPTVPDQIDGAKGGTRAVSEEGTDRAAALRVPEAGGGAPETGKAKTGKAKTATRAVPLPKGGYTPLETAARPTLRQGPVAAGSAEAESPARGPFAGTGTGVIMPAAGDPAQRATAPGDIGKNGPSATDALRDIAPGQTEKTAESASKTASDTRVSVLRAADAPSEAAAPRRSEGWSEEVEAPAAAPAARDGDTRAAQAVQATIRQPDAATSAIAVSAPVSALSVQNEPLRGDAGEVAIELAIGGVDTGGGEARSGARVAGPVPHFAAPDPARNAALQVADIVRASGERAVELRLQPEELGRVHLTMSQDASGTLTVSLNVERAETLDLLRRNIDLLGAELRDLGYGSVDFSFNGEGAAGRDGAPTEMDDAQMAPEGSVGGTEGPVVSQQATAAHRGISGNGMDMRL